MSAAKNDAATQTALLDDALSERYLAYALSTITSRALPDVRDGLKPVQRRILYAMRQLKLDPDQSFKKCARVVGDVIGKFHPHSEAAVYDAVVRLAQDFAERYPLVDGQGNFGNIDGDNAAAMRYTECRLTPFAQALLDGLDRDAVDFKPTYDGGETEPVVLPAAVPNLLANGASGIAVGMATSIPPHNVGELCAALIWLLERPSDAPPATASELCRFVRGPDLPTGGVLIDDAETIAEAYESGRGGFRLRADWTVEKLDHGQYQIVVTQIPYLVQKAKLIERLADQLSAKKLTLLADLRDESTEDVRVVLIPRSRAVRPEVLMEQLFRLSDLEVRVSLNLNVIDARGAPRVMSLAEALDAFLEHRMEVLIRVSRRRLEAIEARLEVLEGLTVAYLNIDEIIRIIRHEDHPKQSLIEAFELTERQAEAILNLRLRQLHKLEEIEINREKKALVAERKRIKALLGDETLRRKALADELRGQIEAFGSGPLGDRRTRLASAPSIDEDALSAPVERAPVTVICSQNGWLRALKGHLPEDAETKFKEGDGPWLRFHATTADKLLLVAEDGRFYTLAVDKLPGGRSLGEPASVHADLAKAVGLHTVFVHRPDGVLIVATRAGRGFLLEEKEAIAQTRAGKAIVNLAKGDRLKAVKPLIGDHVATIGLNRKLLIFPASELPTLARGRGVVLQKYREGELVDVKGLDPAEGLSWRTGSRTRREKDLSPWLGKRGGAGRQAPTGFPRSNTFEEERRAEDER